MKAKIEAILEDYRTWKVHLRKILEKHLQPSKSVEELIEKYKYCGWDNTDQIFEEFIQDLQDLLPEDKEEEVERCSKCWNCIKRDYDDEYCCECWAKIKRVD